MRFLIITHVLHKKSGGQTGGYGPYVREMNLWLKHVDTVRVIAPINHAALDLIDLPYEHSNLEFVPVPAFDLTSPKSALKALFVLPLILLRIVQGMLWADHIHLRCPGNMGLLGCLVQIFFPQKQKTAKYAGNWDPESRQPRSYKLQQHLLSNTFLTHNMQALVYGEWPNLTRNIKPSFTATYHESEIEPLKIRPLARSKGGGTEASLSPVAGPATLQSYATNSLRGNEGTTIKLVFVGVLMPWKQPVLAVKAAHALIKQGVNASLDMMGEGAERGMLEAYIAEHHLQDHIRLLGNVNAEAVRAKLQEAHFLVFISKSEGWPKVVAEAMFWGCVPITTRVSCVPYMLGEGSRGTLIEPTVDAAVAAVEKYLNDPKLYQQHSKAAAEWSRQFTLEKFENEIVKLLRS